MPTRREFTKCLAAVGGVAALAPKELWANNEATFPPGQNAKPDIDILIKGGTVVDPSQKIHGPLDVAVKGSKIVELSRDIPESRALHVVSAKDRIVTPGFIDLHVHCYDGVGIGMNADHYCLGRGVTTAVDAGSTGSFMIGRFCKDIVQTSTTRIFAWLHIGIMGAMVDPAHRYQNLDWVDPESTIQAAEQYKPIVVGIKVHVQKNLSNHPKDLELEYVKRALQAAEATHLPMMGHIWDSYYPLPDILGMMRKGDVYTHCFNNFPHNILDSNGKILPEVREARARGVIFDVGEGPHNLSMAVVGKCLEQDFPPDTLSTDLANPYGIGNNDRDDMPTLVSRFLALGMTLDQAIERVTVTPAHVCNFGLELGTLRPGSQADISIFELREGKFEFGDNADAGGQKRIGHQMLINKSVVCRGQLFANVV
jgi:dihydroorotase